MKKSILLMLFFCLLTACNNEKKNEEVIKPQGVKPVIYYKEQLYWMSSDEPTNELPEGFTSSEEKIVGSEKDPNAVPSKEGFTSSMNSVNVGTEIYTNPNNPNAIVIFTGEKYISFLLDE